MLLLDYIVEHDDRHAGNIGHLRSSLTGEILGMAPFFDFDCCFSSAVIPPPMSIFVDYSEEVDDFVRRVSKVLSQTLPEFSQYQTVLDTRLKEIEQLKKQAHESSL